jgi:RNA-directed DNA polymerase
MRRRSFESKGMKRKTHIFSKITAQANLEAADVIARKGKRHQRGVKDHDKNREGNILALVDMLRNKTYRTSEYHIFPIFEPKRREIYQLPYFPDRVAQHGAMNQLEDIFVRMFTADTYSCIKGRGIHGAFRAVKKALRDQAGTQYCLKLDIRKFYPSIDHDTLKILLRRKFKDLDLLWLLDEIIDSAPGIPIGNYLSQYFANFYLTGFDHWLKEVKGIRYYFRYADDLVFLAPNKPYLHRLLADIREYLRIKLKLEIKPNYQVFPVAARGIDFVGYRFYHTHILLRKSIKKSFARMMAKRPNKASFASYFGWAVHCNSGHLLKTLLNEKFQGLRDKANYESIDRRKNQNRKDIEQADNRISFQNTPINQEAGHRLLVLAVGG